MTINILNQNPTYKNSRNNTGKMDAKPAASKEEISSKNGDSWAAWGVASVLPQLPTILGGNGFVKKMTNENLKLAPEELTVVRESAEKVLEQTKLKDKGVFIKYWQPLKHCKSFRDIAILFSPAGMIRNGLNAGFSTKNIYLPQTQWFDKELLLQKNSINIPEINLNTSVFHEIGHAHNHHFSKLGKFAQSIIFRCAPWVATLSIIFVAFSSKREAKEGEELSTKDKLHNAARDYAPLATLALYVPMIIEEWSASLKGEKFAKNLLKPNIMSAVKNTNRAGLYSYILNSTLTVGSIFLAKVLKDRYTNKNEGEKSPQE